MIVFWALFWLSSLYLVISDYRTQTVPVGVLYAALFCSLILIYPKSISDLGIFGDSIIRGLAGTGLLYWIKAFWADLRSGEECFGDADLMLMGIFGLHLQFQHILEVLCLSSILGVIFAMLYRQRKIPFIPAMILAFLIEIIRLQK